MVTVKLRLNSVISTKGAGYCTIDLKDFYLNTPMACLEYMGMKLNDLVEAFFTLYNLTNKANANGCVYIEIQKGMYGLLQVGILAQELLKACLNKHGYCQSLHWASGATIFDQYLSPYVWTILASRMWGVNMRSTLPPSSMNITNANWNGKVGTWAWTLTGTTHAALFMSPCLNRYPKHSCNFNTHLRVSHNISRTPTSSQIMAPKRSSQRTSTLPCSLTKRAKSTSKRSSALSCITLAVLTAPCYLESAQLHHNSPIRQKTPKNGPLIPHYAATHPNAIINYKASNMVLTGHSDASYLSELNAHSRASGHFFMSNDDPIPANNGAIFTTSQIIKAVMSSAAEA
jgi:hypothetical protein